MLDGERVVQATWDFPVGDSRYILYCVPISLHGGALDPTLGTHAVHYRSPNRNKGLFGLLYIMFKSLI